MAYKLSKKETRLISRVFYDVIIQHSMKHYRSISFDFMLGSLPSTCKVSESNGGHPMCDVIYDIVSITTENWKITRYNVGGFMNFVLKGDTKRFQDDLFIIKLTTN